VLLALVLIVIPVLQKELPLLQAQIPGPWPNSTPFSPPGCTRLGIHVKLDSAGLRDLAHAADRHQRRRDLDARC
jgi:hypothetical protein